MERSVHDAAEGPANLPKARCLCFWPWVLAGLLACQGWMTWCVFGEDALFDNHPILSGLYPQHLYLGLLGAQSLHSSGRSTCLDHSFQALYPKTPVFNGSRFAEVTLYLAGGTYEPMAYKIGLASLCLLVPWLIVMAARGAGLDWTATLLATAAGLVIWWSPCSHDALEAGSSELLFGSLAVLANVGLLWRFHQRPGLFSWLGLVFTAWLAWFAQPMLFPIALPLFLMFYLHVGHHHSAPIWHLALLFGEALSLGANASWLLDWVTFWWLRSPEPIGGGILSHRTLQTIWNAPLWGGPAHRAFGLCLLGSAVIGLAILPRSQRTITRLLGTATVGLFVLALLGISWEPLGDLGTAGLLAPALWFASLPAAYAWTQTFRWIARLTGHPSRAVILLLVPAAVGGALVYESLPSLEECRLQVKPLEYDLGPHREAVIDTINRYTTSEARILWEDMPMPRTAPHWTPLLPLLTGRTFIGGLDPGHTIEHSTIGFSEQTLARIPIAQWTDEALESYCNRYNVGWVICFSPAVVKRFAEWPLAEKTADVTDTTAGHLFTIKRRPAFTLKGQAQLVHADHHHITLADVVPEDGVVVLSLHYQAGMRASPSRVQLERDPDIIVDPIGFLRLRLAGPAARVTITWGDR